MGKARSRPPSRSPALPETLTPAIAADRTGRLVLLANRAEVSYWAIRLGGWLAGRLPLALSYALADGLAELTWRVWGGIRRRTVENMRWVVGARAEPVGRQAFRNYFEYM